MFLTYGPCVLLIALNQYLTLTCFRGFYFCSDQQIGRLSAKVWLFCVFDSLVLFKYVFVLLCFISITTYIIHFLFSNHLKQSILVLLINNKGKTRQIKNTQINIINSVPNPDGGVDHCALLKKTWPSPSVQSLGAGRRTPPGEDTAPTCPSRAQTLNLT